MKKGSIVLVLSLIVFAVSTGAMGAEGSKRLKVGHLRQSGSAIDQDLHRLIEKIGAETDNKILFDIYPGNRLGDYSVVQERVAFGEVDIYVGPLSTSIDKRLLLATIPYLVNTWQEAKKVYSRDSELFKVIAGFLEEQNIKLLGGWPVYFGGIALTKEPPQPENADVAKKMIIRVPPIRSFELTARQLGYTPYPITWTYAKMGLKTGMVAGMIGGGAEGYAGLGDLVKYYVPVKDHFEYWFVYMNLDAWKDLSPEEQQFFLVSTRDMELNRYGVAEAQEKASIELLKKQGTTIIELSEDQLSAMRKKIQKTVWPVLEKELGPVFKQIVSGVQKSQ